MLIVTCLLQVKGKGCCCQGLVVKKVFGTKCQSGRDRQRAVSSQYQYQVVVETNTKQKASDSKSADSAQSYLEESTSLGNIGKSCASGL